MLRKFFLLIEVLLACAFLSLALLPILRPQIFFSRDLSLFCRGIEREMLSQQLYLDLRQDIYENNLPWKDLLEGKSYSSPPQSIDAFSFSYTLTKILPKDFPSQGPYLMGVEMRFQEGEQLSIDYYHFLTRGPW